MHWRLALILYAFATLGLSACAKNGELGFDHHPIDCAVGFQHSDCLPGTTGYANSVAMAESDDATCRSYGLDHGTPAYAQCRQNIANQRMASQQAAIDALVANRPRSTTCNTIGGMTNCTTY
jgi:hypothetical protein